MYKKIRKDNNVSVNMITARGKDFEKIIGLNIGVLIISLNYYRKFKKWRE